MRKQVDLTIDMRRMDLVLIEGDGIGPEITTAALKVLLSTGIPINVEKRPAGLLSLEKNSELVPEETLTKIKEFGYAIKGPFTTPSGGDQRSANWVIRQSLQLYACVRPLLSVFNQIDAVIIRENTEDLYGGIEWASTTNVRHAVKITTREGSERIAKFAYNFCRKENRDKVTVVHKANNLKMTEGLFLQECRRIAASYPEIELNDMLVDTAAYQLVKNPQQFDVILTSSSFGDILSSLGAALLGGLGLSPSVSFGKDVTIAEGTHGSAPDIAGTGKANPVAIIGASAMMLKSAGFISEAQHIQEAIRWAEKEGIATPDAGGSATTSEVSDELSSFVRRRRNKSREKII